MLLEGSEEGSKEGFIEGEMLGIKLGTEVGSMLGRILSVGGTDWLLLGARLGVTLLLGEVDDFESGIWLPLGRADGCFNGIIVGA